MQKIKTVFAVFRSGRVSVQLHVRRLHEAGGGYSRPAAERWSQRHRLQWTAGSYSGHHG